MKILVISNNPFSNCFNNGKTLESLFSWASKDNLAQLFFHDAFNPDLDFCNNYFKVSDKEILRNLFNRNACGRIIEKNVVSCPEGKQYKTSSVLSSLQCFRDILWKMGYRNKKRALLHEWVLNFAPDCIFFVGGNCGFAHGIALDIAELCRAKLYSYFTDDYIIYPKYKNILKNVQRERLKRIYDTTIEASSCCFVIGEMMALEYSKYYKRQFFPIMNSVPIIDFPPKPCDNEFVISYFGNLSLNRWKMIIRFAQLLNCVKGQACIVLRVYSTSIPDKHVKELFSINDIHYMGMVLGDDYREALINSDMLLHIESDNLYDKSLTRLSVSTKLPEYMVTCRPIIAYGPKEVASMALLSDNNIGYVLNSESVASENEFQLSKILTLGSAEYRKMANRAFSYVSKHFSSQNVLGLFAQLIANHSN